MRQHNLRSMVQSLFRRVLRSATRPARDGLESNAALGDADAQFHLGLMHSSGISGTPDYARAAEWYRKAAEQNHALAQVNLGTMYDSGQGMQEDGREAAILPALHRVFAVGTGEGRVIVHRSSTCTIPSHRNTAAAATSGMQIGRRRLQDFQRTGARLAPAPQSHSRNRQEQPLWIMGLLPCSRRILEAIVN